MAGPSKSLSLIVIILGVVCSTTAGFVLVLLPTPDRTYQQNQISSLPDGYAPILDSSVAYKLYNDVEVTWMRAKRLCESEGARLAVADNQEINKRLVGKNLKKIHVGIHSQFDKWVSLRDGSALKNLPWRENEPLGTYDCVVISTSDGELESFTCDVAETHYACEIPMPQKHV